MNCELKQLETSDLSDKDFCVQVFQCVAYIIHKCPILQELFLKWSTLTAKEQIFLNYIAFHVIDKNEIDLYAPVIQGFVYWNNIQDTEGACGFHENPLEFKFNLDEEKRIFQLILVIDQLINNILIRPTLCEEIQKNKISERTNNVDSKIFCSGEGDTF